MLKERPTHTCDKGWSKSVQIQGIVKIYRGPFETSCPTFVGYAVLVWAARPCFWCELDIKCM